MSKCPACLRPTLAQAGAQLDLRGVLRRWEETIGTPFSKQLWQDYEAACGRPILQLRCNTCGFGCFDPPVVGSGAFYEAIGNHEYYVPEKWEFRQAIADLRRAHPRHVLDVGCGYGHFLRLLRDQEPSIASAGQEVYAAPLEALRREGFETILGDAADLAGKTNHIEPFDALTMFQVLEHVANPWMIIAACSALLKPGGTFIVSTPDAGGPITNFPNALTEIPPHHVTQWTEAAYRACLPRYGFEIIRVRREPLPQYLWDAYLPALWDKGIWPAKLLGPFIDGTQTNGEAELTGAMRILKQTGITHLREVPGHTIYILARRSDDR